VSKELVGPNENANKLPAGSDRCQLILIRFGVTRIESMDCASKTLAQSMLIRF
jgi:hypothetical protein